MEEHRRSLHLDLADMPLDDVDRERVLARLRWSVDAEPSPWLETRLRRLDETAARLRREMQ